MKNFLNWVMISCVFSLEGVFVSSYFWEGKSSIDNKLMLFGAILGPVLLAVYVAIVKLTKRTKKCTE